MLSQKPKLFFRVSHTGQYLLAEFFPIATEVISSVKEKCLAEKYLLQVFFEKYALIFNLMKNIVTPFATFLLLIIRVSI